MPRRRRSTRPLAAAVAALGLSGLALASITGSLAAGGGWGSVDASRGAAIVGRQPTPTPTATATPTRTPRAAASPSQTVTVEARITPDGSKTALASQQVP